MDKIENKSLSIEKIFQQVFVELTRKMISVEMVPLPWIEEEFKKGYFFLICTEGAFTSSVQFQMEEDVYEKIAETIYKKRQMSEEEKKLYVTEYLNIICGRVLSEISDSLGKRSRLSVPMRVKEHEASDTLRQKVRLSYRCSFGMLHIVIYFDLDE